jgi:hypothetical protein
MTDTNDRKRHAPGEVLPQPNTPIRVIDMSTPEREREANELREQARQIHAAGGLMFRRRLAGAR